MVDITDEINFNLYKKGMIVAKVSLKVWDEPRYYLYNDSNGYKWISLRDIGVCACSIMSSQIEIINNIKTCWKGDLIEVKILYFSDLLDLSEYIRSTKRNSTFNAETSNGDRKLIL